MTRSFYYDAENRQVTACINCASGNPTATYQYDGNGLRVSKATGGQTTTYVYDAWGNVAAEYSTQPSASPCGTATCYVTTDHLGSTRMLTDSAGSSVVQRYDYQPFGMELLAGIGGRATGMGYLPLADNSYIKFTGQGRDSETKDSNTQAGLDWFNARYLSSPQGRFQSTDPGNAGADLTNPQTWNGYAYVSNNPLSYTDPSGLGIFGDIGSIIGSFFPGLGTLIGWGIGSIADLATGQSISPPGFDIGGAIFGSIAGGVNNGPWSGSPGLGSGGGLNTGTVFGSGGTGPFIFNLEDGTQPQTTGQFFRSYWSTAGFLYNFATGTGPRIRYYGPNDYRTRDLMSSKGFQVVNQQIKQGCQAGKSNGTLNLSTWQGAKDIPYDIFHSPVGGEVGGYNGTWSTSGGTTQVNIVNYAGAYSFFYHAVNDRTGTSGPFRTIKQTFVIKEPGPCGK